jgi:hypothetical protein
MTAVAKQAKAFLENLPTVHERGTQPAHSGGLNPRLGQVMVDEIQRLGTPRVIETGAGNSTLLFLMLGCSSVTSIAPDEKLGLRIQKEAADRKIDASALTYINDRSERALPKLAFDGVQCDAGFIDGNHGWPSVFVDFCYLNMMMGKGAILFIDDVQVYACAQLQLLLRAQEADFELVSLVGKMATFRKVTPGQFLPDWRGEPFIVANSTGVIPGL